MSSLKSLKFWLLLLIGSVLATVAFFLLTNTRERLMPKRFELSGTDADLRIKDVFLTEDKGGAKAWELKAEWARMYRKKNKTIFEDLRVKVYVKGRRPMHITGEAGEMDNETKDIRIRGNVEIVSEEGYTLRTESLVWHNERREIVTEEAVAMAGKNFRLTGRGLRVKVDDERLWLQKQVTANLMPTALQTWAAMGEGK
ncbi:MAG: LPS export ABC transporter periplasmic protein LptC [Nitrospinota bacterium]